MQSDIQALSDDLSNLRADGRPAPQGAAAAITSARKAIRAAVAEANSDIATVNADVTRAYSIANGLATGSCSGDGPGATPAPIATIPG